LGIKDLEDLEGKELEETKQNNEGMLDWFKDVAWLYLESIEELKQPKLEPKIEPSMGQSLMTVFEHGLKAHIRGGGKPPKHNQTGTLSIKFQYNVTVMREGNLTSRMSRLGINEDDIIMTFDNPQQLATEDLDSDDADEDLDSDDADEDLDSDDATEDLDSDNDDDYQQLASRCDECKKLLPGGKGTYTGSNCTCV
jgi:hypothetical protein